MSVASDTASPRLFGLSTSPWTAKASFSLDWAGIPYVFVEHTPMLGERRLRKLAGTRLASVPLLVGPEGPIMGSLEIARWADASSTAQLFPIAMETDVLAWHQRSERLLESARALLLQAALASPIAQQEAVPGFVPEPLRPAFRFAARQGLEFLMRKYRVPRSDGTELLASVHEELAPLRRAVAEAGERTTLLARFTFADVAMACALNGFSPTDAEPRTRSMGRGFRAAWHREEIVSRYPELFAWRDRIYEQHRGAFAS